MVNIDLNQTLQYVGFLSEKSVKGINSLLTRFLPDATSQRTSLLIYWISVLVVIYFSVLIIKKVHPIIKIILIILIILLALGYFVPWEF